MKELMDSHSRSDAEIEKKWIPTVGRMKELMDSHSRSDAEIAKVDSHSRSDEGIDGFPQQLR